MMMENRLITARVKEVLGEYPLYSQDGKKKDAICRCVFRIGNIRWYILEGQEEGNDFTFYGIVLGLFENEYGYVSANEMQNITLDAHKNGLGMLRIEPDMDFEPTRLCEIKDAELQEFLNRMYDED